MFIFQNVAYSSKEQTNATTKSQYVEQIDKKFNGMGLSMLRAGECLTNWFDQSYYFQRNKLSSEKIQTCFELTFNSILTRCGLATLNDAPTFSCNDYNFSKQADGNYSEKDIKTIENIDRYFTTLSVNNDARGSMFKEFKQILSKHNTKLNDEELNQRVVGLINHITLEAAVGLDALEKIFDSKNVPPGSLSLTILNDGTVLVSKGTYLLFKDLISDLRQDVNRGEALENAPNKRIDALVAGLINTINSGSINQKFASTFGADANNTMNMAIDAIYRFHLQESNSRQLASANTNQTAPNTSERFIQQGYWFRKNEEAINDQKKRDKEKFA